MKKFLFLYLVFLTLSVKGQTPVYHPLVNNNSNWLYQEYVPPGNPTNHFLSYSIKGDTTIASVDYKKIYADITNYQGALRENSKVIYFLPDTSSNEYVLYNFNLNKGDTIFHPYGGAACSILKDTVIIEQVDSILLADGYHRHLYLSSMAEWIEGVGNTTDLLRPANVICLSPHYFLVCMTNALLSYPSANSPCILSIQGNSSPPNTISVFPNPSNGSFAIDFENADVKEVFIADLVGKIVFRLQIDKQKKIDVANLPGGIYILSVIDKYNRTTTRKITCL